MARCGDGKLLFCVLFLSCCIATLARITVMCCTKVNRTRIKKTSVVDYYLQVRRRDCPIAAVIFVTRDGRKLCFATDTRRSSAVMRYVDDRKKFCKENNYPRKQCFGVKTENDPEPTAFHSPAMTTPPTFTTLAQGPVDCCTDVSRPIIERRSLADYRRQFQGQHGCSLDAVILVTRHGKKLCVATDLPGLSDVMRHVDNLKKVCKENYLLKHCSGVKIENDPEPTAFHSPAMTTPPTMTTLADRPMDCCTDVSRTTIERHSVTDYRRQFQGQHGCPIDAVIFVDRRGRKFCEATDSPRLSAMMRHVDDRKKESKQGRGHWRRQRVRWRHV